MGHAGTSADAFWGQAPGSELFLLCSDSNACCSQGTDHGRRVPQASASIIYTHTHSSQQAIATEYIPTLTET